MILFSFWESGNLHSLLLQYIREKDVLISFEVKPEPLKDSSWTSCVSVFQRNWSHRVLLEMRFTIRNWLTWLWRLTSLKSAGQASRLETQGGWGPMESWCCRLNRKPSEGRPPFSWENFFFFFLMASNWWDEAHPHYGGQSVLFKVSWL